MAVSSHANPFDTPSTLPHQLPPFDKIRPEHYLPAFERAMAYQLDRVAAIVDSGTPTFDNTVIALEQSSRLLERVSAVFFHQALVNTEPAVQSLQADLAPRLARHRDEIHLNRALFERVQELFDRRERLGLDEESLRLVVRWHADFVRAGAGLDLPDLDRLRSINEQLATLCTEFQLRLRADTDASAVVVSDLHELEGLDQAGIEAAAHAADRRGLTGRHVLELVACTQQPVLRALNNRPLRERLFLASVHRGAKNDRYNTSSIVTRIASLRAQRAQLLGYPDHATYVLADSTVGTSTALDHIVDQVTPLAVQAARGEADRLRGLLDAGGEGAGILRPWDRVFYAERVRRDRYGVDDAALRPYFEFERVLRDGVFFAAGELYGLAFVERHDLPTYHPDVRVFEVYDGDGSPRGLFLGDYLAREAKHGMPWMNTVVYQSHLHGRRPVVGNNLSLPRPPPGNPVLLTIDQVKLVFHEFGHALHGLLSSVRYPRFSGTRVPLDAVEYPSVVNEMWATWPEVLVNYAKHHRTGAPMPPELFDGLLASQSWEMGFTTTEYLAAVVLDQAWHRLGPADHVEDVETFEAGVLRRAGVNLPAASPHYRTTYFSHVFAGDYAAAYYSYLWSEILATDTFEWFKENGGLRRDNGDWFRRTVLSRGGSADMMDAFRAFRGRDPEIEPFLNRRGLTS